MKSEIKKTELEIVKDRAEEVENVAKEKKIQVWFKTETRWRWSVVTVLRCEDELNLYKANQVGENIFDLEQPCESGTCITKLLSANSDSVWKQKYPNFNALLKNKFKL